MRSFLAIASPALALFQTVFSAPSHYDPVPYDQAPSYYPGAPWSFPTSAYGRKTCKVAVPENGGNSVPNILEAFQQCGNNGKVIFQDTTYHIDSVMEITGLSNVEVDIRGTLLWSTDISYWLANSLPMGYQSQSTAFIFGGDKIHMHSSNGKGTFNGNGQVWYERYGAISNYPRRPHQITFNGLTDSVVEGIKFVQSQMWTMTLIHSSKVLLQDIYVNNTNFQNNAYGNNLNTDGANTIYASDITFARWVVDNGDDNIAFKANSTNILVEDGSFYRSTGIAFGSIGQFAGEHEIIEDIVVRNIAAYDNKYFAYVKTWTGVVQGTPPNGGGAGLGYLRNVSLSNSMAENALQAFYITQCNSYSGFTGQCDTSKFQISDFSIDTVGGTLQTDVVASMQCSGAAPCSGISIRDVLFTANTGETASQYLCSNVEDPDGFECTGKAPQTE